MGFEGDALDRVHGVVVGAGVVGLAVARALALSEKGRGRDWLVMESESAIGTGTSSRNSEVIHAGIYYPSGSLKARLCVAGRDMLYAYCAARGIPHRRCGKMIVATRPGQDAYLAKLQAQALANGVDDLRMLSRDELAELERPRPVASLDAVLVAELLAGRLVVDGRGHDLVDVLFSVKRIY